MLFFNVIGAALGVTVIPVLSEYLRNRGREAALDLANNLLNVVLVFSAVLVAFGEVFAPQVVRVVSPGFHGEVYVLAVRLTRVVLPAIIFYSASGMMTGTLQALEQFTAPAMVGIPQNLLIILAILFLGPVVGIGGVAIGLLAAGAAQVLIQAPGLAGQGFKYRLALDLKDPGIRRIGRLVLPVVLGTSAGQLGLVVDRMLASGLPAGSISALNYAQRVSALPFGIFTVAVSTVLYPRLAQAAAGADWEGYRRSLAAGIRAIAFLTLPMMVGLIVLREPIVRVLFERGAFDARGTEATAFALLFFGVGLLTMSLADLLSRAYFAVQDTVTPLLIGVGAVAVNIVLNLLLIRRLAHGGLALGTSLASLFSAAMLLLLLRRRVPGVGRLQTLRSVLVSAGAAVTMGVAVRWAYPATSNWFRPGFLGGVLHLGAVIALGGAVYLVTAVLLRSPEMSSAWRLLQSAASGTGRRTGEGEGKA
jgi:putative peptidoglycan lipid II flippase